MILVQDGKLTLKKKNEIEKFDRKSLGRIVRYQMGIQQMEDKKRKIEQFETSKDQL